MAAVAVVEAEIMRLGKREFSYNSQKDGNYIFRLVQKSIWPIKKTMLQYRTARDNNKRLTYLILVSASARAASITTTTTTLRWATKIPHRHLEMQSFT